MKNICKAEDFYLHSVILSFVFDEDDLKYVNDCIYRMYKKYKKNSSFVLNADAYTLNDYKLPLLQKYRTFGYGKIGSAGKVIKNIEPKIIQIQQNIFLGIFIIYFWDSFISDYNELCQTNPYEPLTLKIYKELKYDNKNNY
jgi:hypothetical protein